MHIILMPNRQFQYNIIANHISINNHSSWNMLKVEYDSSRNFFVCDIRLFHARKRKYDHWNYSQKELFEMTEINSFVDQKKFMLWGKFKKIGCDKIMLKSK